MNQAEHRAVGFRADINKENIVKHSFVTNMVAGLLVALSLVGCQSGDDKQAKIDDAKKTEGTWTLVGGENEGVAIPEEGLKNSKLTIVGDVYTVQLGDMGTKKGTQKLDATKSPKQIDAQDSEGPTVGKNLGIYEFMANGDFRVCFAATGKERPTEFVTKPGSGHFVHVWRRAQSK